MVATVFFEVLGGQYIWDDRTFFKDAADLRQGPILQAIVTPVLAGTAYFRPLVMASFVAEIRTFSSDPLYSHIANLLFHLVNVFLVGLLCRRMVGSSSSKNPRSVDWTVFAAMLLYGLHPALVEPVAWISGRFDLMVTCCCLAALLLATSGRRSLELCSGIAFLAAALSKEMAATLPVLLFFVLWAMKRPSLPIVASVKQTLKTEWRAYASLLLAGLLYLGLRIHYLPRMVTSDNVLEGQLQDPWRHIAFVGQTLLFYAKTIALPFSELGPLHPFEPAWMLSNDVAQGIGVLAGACLLGLVALFRPSRSGLLLLAAGVSLLPVLNVVPLAIVGSIGQARFLVLPLALVVLSVVSLEFSTQKLSAFMRKALPVLGAAGAVFWLLFACLNIRVTIPMWHDEITFWQWIYRMNPEAPIAQFSLATEAINVSRFDIVKEVLDRAQSRGPLPVKLAGPYARYLKSIGRTEEGVAMLTTTLKEERQPHLDVLRAGVELADAQIAKADFSAWYLVYAYNELAQSYLTLRQFEQAKESADIAVFYQRDNPLANLSLSLAIYGLDRWEDGQSHFVHTQDLYVPSARKDVDAVRLSFLNQLCRQASTAPHVCQEFRAESQPSKLNISTRQ